ncbi:MAG: helix-turn-helix transcriptional regulator [Bacteroidales bacterium]|nr:helix-turn-helix transcriptional regulator [Bacteroidales bacterium]
MDNEKIKQRIFARRKQVKKNQADAAAEIGLTETAYRNIEKGPTRLVSDRLASIASCLGTTEEFLLLGYEPVQASADELRAADNFREQLHALAEDYESRIRGLQDTIRHLGDLLEAKDGELTALRKLVRELEARG